MAKHEQKDFLKDRDFIIWRLTGDPYLESFWEEYLETRPEQKESFDKAIRDFAKTKLNDERMPAEEGRLSLELSLY